VALRHSQDIVRPERASTIRAPNTRGSTAVVAQTWQSDDKYAWVTSLMFAVMLLTLIVPSELFNGRVHDLVANQPSILFRTLKSALIVSSVLILAWRSALAVKLLRELNPFQVASAALMLLSTTWSIEPAITLFDSSLTCQILLVSTAFVLVGWHRQRLQDVLRPVLTLALVASLILGALSPNLGREFGTTFALAGAWRGVFAQKNALGDGAALGVVFWLHAWLAKETRFWRFAVSMGVCIACLILSRSSTSILVAVFVSLLLLLLMKGPAGKRGYVVVLSVLFVALILLYSLAVLKILPGLDFLLEPVVALTGKDMTFSGRTEIWAVVKEHIKLHPLLGTGYGAYWIGPLPRSPSIATMARYSDYYPGQAHNGYLDVINDLGYVGLVCLLGYIVVYLRQSVVLLRTDYTLAVLYLALLLYQLICNLSSADWFAATALDFVVTIQVVFALARAALDRRLLATQTVQRPLPPPRAAGRGSL
jgi:exopolysaccharide production protein ExoQ